MGWNISRIVPVFYFMLDESDAIFEVNLTKACGSDLDGPLHIIRLEDFSTKNVDALMKTLKEDILDAKEKYGVAPVIIFDTVRRALNIKDLNDYVQVDKAFAPCRQLASETEAAF